MITKILKSNKMNTNNISKLFIILFALLIVFLSISISSAEEDYEITEVDEVKVLYVATPGFYAFNFMDLVGSHYRGARFDVDFVAGYKPDGFWGTPHDDFYALAENNYEGYDIVFLDMVNMYRDAFQTGADNAAANGTILISIMTGPSATPPHTCYMPMSFTIRDHPELSTGPYSDDKEFIDKFFSIYSYAKSGQLNVDYQYDDNSIIEMRNLLMDEIIERKSPYEFCEVNYKDLSEFGDVYIMKNFEPHENIKHVHKGAKLEFKAVPFKGYEIDYWIGAVENPNDKSIATLTVNENTDVKVVFKKSEPSICKLYINYGTDKNEVMEVSSGTELPELYAWKKGYALSGWTDLNGKKIEYDHIVEEDLHINAVWKKLPRLNPDSTSENADITDVIYLLQYTANIGIYASKTKEEMIEYGADLNDDGSINIVDVIIFLKSI